MLASAEYRRGYDAGYKQGLLDAVHKARYVTAQPSVRPAPMRDGARPFYDPSLDRDAGDPQPLDRQFR